MPAHIRVSGTYQEADEIHVKVGGSWREVQQGYIKVAGTWELFHGSLVFVGEHTIADVGVIFKGVGSAQASVQFDNDGTIDASVGGLGSVSPAIDDGVEWCPAGTPADYHIRVTATGDTGAMSGDSLNTWYDMGGIDREWTINTSGGTPDSVSVTLTIEFSEDGGSTVSDTFTDVITLSASIS